MKEVGKTMELLKLLSRSQSWPRIGFWKDLETVDSVNPKESFFGNMELALFSLNEKTVLKQLFENQMDTLHMFFLCLRKSSR